MARKALLGLLPVAVVTAMLPFVAMVGAVFSMGSSDSGGGCTTGVTITQTPTSVAAANTLTLPTTALTKAIPASVSGYSGQQLVIAAAIIKAGQDLNLDAWVVTVAVMTGMGESSLTNVAHGDAVRSDTVGVFQEGPERGPLAQRMDPAGAAKIFYAYLEKVPNYHQLQPTIAAHKAQSNADPYHYAKYWDPAVAVVAALINNPNMSTLLAGTGTDLCDPAANAVTGAAGPVDAATLMAGVPRANPHTPAQAIAWAQQVAASHQGGWSQGCLRFVATAYGWHASGVDYAIDEYTDYTPAALRHPRDLNAPAGALMFWTTSHRAGHVALSLGNGMIASNDIVVDGQISIVPATDIAAKWGATYVGWAPPYFPAGS